MTVFCCLIALSMTPIVALAQEEPEISDDAPAPIEEVQAIVDAPVKLSLYLFSMPTEEIRALSQDGFTSEELDRLQKSTFATHALTPNDAPIVLAPGDNHIRLDSQIAQRLRGLGASASIVYLIEAERVNAARGATVLSYRSFGASWATGERVISRPSEGRWTMPAGMTSYRYVDFRYASMAHYPVLVHEMAVEIDGETYEFEVILEF